MGGSGRVLELGQQGHWHTAHRDILEQILCEGPGALGLFVT